MPNEVTLCHRKHLCLKLPEIAQLQSEHPVTLGHPQVTKYKKARITYHSEKSCSTLGFYGVLDRSDCSA